MAARQARSDVYVAPAITVDGALAPAAACAAHLDEVTVLLSDGLVLFGRQERHGA